MSDKRENENKLGAVLVQVHEDLRQLKCSIEKVSAGVSDKATPLDVQALDNAICMAHSTIKKHAEDYLKTVNKQQLVLPSIKDLQKQTLKTSKWIPPLESLPNIHSQRKELPGHLPTKKVNQPRKITRSVPSLHVTKAEGHHFPFIAEDKVETVLQQSLLSPSVQHKVSFFHPNQDSYPSKSVESNFPKWQTNSESNSVKKVDACAPVQTWKIPPPSTASKSMDLKNEVHDTNCLVPKSSQNMTVDIPENVTKYSFTISKGQINPMDSDFCHFKQSFTLCWSNVLDALEALKKLLGDFGVPLATVNGERLVNLCHGWDAGRRKAPSAVTLLSVLDNQEEVSDLVSRPGQRYKGEGGTEAAAVLIQSCWRRCLARTAYLWRCRCKWAAHIIAMSWWQHAQRCRFKKALEARRFSQLENHRRRAQHLAANWKRIQSFKRTIIHIPSLGFSQSQRLELRRYDILQNTQISRLCDVRDENVEVIYVCSQHLGEDILQYYSNLLNCDGAKDVADTRNTQALLYKRHFIILTPEAVDYFPLHNMCLSTLLKYSPRTLKRIKHLIQGKQAYIVGGVSHMDDLAVADELDVPILGSEPAVSQLYTTKSGGRRIFAAAEVDVPPGQADIYSLNQLHETVAELMTQNINMQRWLFKMNLHHGGRVVAAYCDVCHLGCYKWALQQYHHYGPDLWGSEWIQEIVLHRFLDEIPEWLAHYAQLSKTSSYPSWSCFLKTFLRQGGVVEACPPSESVTYLTVDMLLEPVGEVTMLSCGDQLHGSCQLEAIGSTVPQISVHPDTLHSICMRVGRACLQHLIVGYVSVGLATFMDHRTMEQKVWVIDLDIAYSDQLAMTQMLLLMTGGTLNWQTGCLEVQMPIGRKLCEHQAAVKNPVVSCHAVIGSHLFHSNLSMLYHSSFFKICKLHGIGFNKKQKQGTVFAFYDSNERCSIGMITISENLQGALVTFVQNLSVIHQQISSSKMQGETNFKELMKSIEDVLQIISRNKNRLKDKPAA